MILLMKQDHNKYILNAHKILVDLEYLNMQLKTADWKVKANYY